MMTNKYDPRDEQRVYDTIKLYQSKHNGQSPSLYFIGNELSIEPFVARRHIERLENQGRLFVASRYPLQIMFPKGEEPVLELDTPVAFSRATAQAATQKQTQATSVATPVAPKSSSKRALPKSYDERKVEVAKAISEFWRSHSCWPQVRDIDLAVFGKQTGSASRLVQRMKDQGLVNHKHNSNKGVRLTPLGRETLLGERTRRALGQKRWEGVSKEERRAHMRAMSLVRWGKVKSDTPEQPAAPTRKTPTVRLSRMERAKQIAQAIDDGVRSVNQVRARVYPNHKARTGGRASIMIQWMAAEGWVEHKPFKQNDLKLTELGRQVLLGEEQNAIQQELSDEARAETKAAEVAISPEGTTKFLRTDGTWEAPSEDRSLGAVDVHLGLDDPSTASSDAPDNIMVPVNPRDVVRELNDLDLVLELNQRGYVVTRR